MTKRDVSCLLRWQVMIMIPLLITIGAALSGCAYPVRHTVAQHRRLELLLKEGVLQLRNNNEVSLSRAQAAFELAYELAPDDPRPLDGLGAVAFRRGAPKTARKLFMQALTIAPRYSRAYANLAFLAERSGDRTEALRLLRLALQLNPLDYQARNNYAAVLSDTSTSGQERRVALMELLKAQSEAPLSDSIIDRNIQRVTDER